MRSKVRTMVQEKPLVRIGGTRRTVVDNVENVSEQETLTIGRRPKGH